MHWTRPANGSIGCGEAKIWLHTESECNERYVRHRYGMPVQDCDDKNGALNDMTGVGRPLVDVQVYLMQQTHHDRVSVSGKKIHTRHAGGDHPIVRKCMSQHCQQRIQTRPSSTTYVAVEAVHERHMMDHAKKYTGRSC